MDWMTFLGTVGEVLMRALLGAAGAGVRICAGKDNGEVFSRWKIAGMIITGFVASGSIGTAMYVWVGLPAAAIWIGSLLIGVTAWAALVWLIGPGTDLLLRGVERWLNALGGKPD